MAIGDFEMTVMIGTRRRGRVECLGVSRADAARFCRLFETTWAAIPRWARAAIVRGWRWRRGLGLREFPIIRLGSKHRLRSQFFKGQKMMFAGCFHATRGYAFCSDELALKTDSDIRAVVAHELAHDLQFSDDGLRIENYSKIELEQNANAFVKIWGFNAAALWPAANT